MFDLKENSARFGNCQYCETSCEYVCCACKAWYCSDPCIAIDWNKHKNYCKPRTVHIDNYEKCIQNSNCYSIVNGSSVTVAKDDVKTSKETTLPIPSDKYTKIVVSWIDEPIYWAYRLDDAEIQTKIKAKLDVYCNSTRAKKMSPDDNKCCAAFDGSWYRAKILSKNEDMAVVRFIDFGNDATIKLSEALKVPEELQLVEPLAFQVKFPYGKPNIIALNIAFDVKAIKLDGDKCEVQILGYALKSETSSVPYPRPSKASVEDSFNVHDMVKINDTSADKSDLQKPFNNQQRQNTSDDRSLPRTINEREKVSRNTETPFIPTDRFTKIVVSWVDEPIYWVYRYDDVNTQSMIEDTLNVHCTSIRDKRISPDDNICCAPFDGAWYRAKILSKDGDTAVVRFIDFGNDASIKLSEALKVPEQLLLFKSLAFKVKFASEKPNSITINSVFDVKAIKQDGDTCEVQIQGFPIKNESMLNSSSPTVAVEGSLNRHDRAVSTSAGITDHKYQFNLHQDQNKMAIANEKLLEGAVVTSKEHIPSLPTDKFTKNGDICEMQIHECQMKSEASAINSPPPTVSTEDSFNGHNGANSTNSTYAITDTNGKNDVYEAQVSPKVNVPIPTDRFTKIVISWIDDPFCWAFRLDDFETHFVIEKILHAYCMSPRMTRISPDDNTCCALFEGGWYRAKILSKDNDTALVRFIDYGNDASIKLNEAIKVPEKLLVFEPLAFKVRFMGGKPNNIEINDSYDVKAVKQDGDICEVLTRRYEILSVSPIPTDRFTKIVVSWIDDLFCWVFKSDDLEIQSKIKRMLHIYTTSPRTKRISPDDNKCCTRFDGAWYRAKILSKDNDMALVRLMDFGNDISTKLNEVRKLPEELLVFEPLAFQVRFLDGKPNNITINDTIDVKAVKQDGDVCEVQCQIKSETLSVIDSSPPTVSISDNIVLPLANGVKTQDIPKETIPPRIPVLHYSPKRRNNHLIYHIEPSLSTVSVQAQTFIGENCTTGFIVVDDALKNISAFKSIKEIAKELSITRADPEFKPSLMDEVCARLGGIWYRGIVTLINPDKTNVALVDIGVIVVPDALARRLPQHLKSIPESAVRCIFSTSQKTNLVGEQIVLQNLQKEAGKLTGDTDKFGQVAIIPWEPTCEDAGIISENIKPGILYKLTAFHSPQEIYLQSKEQNQTLRLNNLIRDVTTYSLKAPLLIRKPWCGQLVSCRSHKNTMYSRAQVLKKIGDQYEVKYIDSGLIETVALSNFKPLSDKLKSVPSFVTKVGLKGIPGSSFNNETIKIMNQLMDKDSLITVEIENNDHTKIRLFEGKKDINRLIYEALLPSWSSRNKTDSVIFMSNDIMYEKWFNGQNMPLTILSVKGFNEIVVANEQSEVFANVVSMTTTITHFCFSDTTPYSPRVQEICLAKFQDESGSSWYRALCSSSYENSATLYLIDFGNFREVSHTDIRKIPPEFLDFPAASKTCKIYGLSDSLPDDIKEDIANVYTDRQLDSMVVCDNDDGTAVLYVPKLMDILAQHNLSITPPPTPFLIPASSF